MRMVFCKQVTQRKNPIRTFAALDYYDCFIKVWEDIQINNIIIL